MSESKSPIETAAEQWEARRKHYLEIGNLGDEAQQKLSTFLISSLLVFCAYSLINFEKYSAINYGPVMFLIAGIGVIIGFSYKVTLAYYFEHHAKQNPFAERLATASEVLYFLQLFIAGIFFIFFLWVDTTTCKKFRKLL